MYIHVKKRGIAQIKNKRRKTAKKRKREGEVETETDYKIENGHRDYEWGRK